jgi:23S rRNA (guanine2445-N2)-methyltransferase / 23S rRNA (guanine2069-N7)-methyltransferase
MVTPTSPSETPPAKHAAPPESFFATCPRNTEGLLAEELRGLGAADAKETRGGATFTGPVPLAYRACLWSRTASRVLMHLASFPTGTIDELYDAVRDMPWERHVKVDGTLAIETTSTIRLGPLATVNTHFVEQRVKDAVVDRFRAKTGRRPGVELARPDVRIAVHLSPAEIAVSLDLSGEGLHRRGYRLEGGGAPLKENLAAAILLRAGWPAVAARGGALLDPMCGSGTLLIEGALMAADIAPGLGREYFGFLGWEGFDPAAWQELLAEAAERRNDGLTKLPPLFGSDSDARALGAARANARRAGLAGRNQFTVRDLRALTAPTGVTPGLVATNPPYGKRLGEVTELTGLYETLGERLKLSFSRWEAAVFTANPDLTAHLGLRARRVNVLFNGPLEAKLLVFDIGAGFAADRPAGGMADGATGGPLAVGGARAGASAPGPAPAVVDRGAGALMFANRLQKNFKHLRKWAAREGISCYRVYDADLPEYAVAVDLYDGWAHVQEYAPPGTVDPVHARRRLKDVMAVVPDVLGIPESHAVLKVRSRQRGAEQYEKLQDRGSFHEVEESGLKFLVNLTDYLDTGLFLDHRPVRQLIRSLAPGRSFLNLFAYTGSATVYAAAGGATATTTVDLSRVYLEWAERNLELNGLAGPQHGFIRADCMEWLKGTSGAGRGGAGAGPGQRGGASGVPGKAPQYDLILLDAPTFSNSKNMEGTLDIQRDHAWLIHSAMALLAPGGILLFSTNFRRFKLDPVLAEEFKVVDITKQTVPTDYARNPRIHTCFRIEALGSGPATAPEGAAAPAAGPHHPAGPHGR